MCNRNMRVEFNLTYVPAIPSENGGTTIFPNQTFIGKPPVPECWAVSVAPRPDGSFAFFFSDGGSSMGVMTASDPSLSDAVDALGRPLVSTVARPTVPAGVTVTNLTRGSYDPTVLIDDEDGGTAAYVCFGVRDDKNGIESHYLLARLADNLTAFAEAPSVVKFLPNPVDGSSMPGDDKSTLHKHNGTYYLSAGSFYSTATSIRGPWTFRGSSNPHLAVSEDRSFGDTSQGHGRFFEWRRQWFHVWCEFVGQNNTGHPLPKGHYPRYRDSWMTYTHYGRHGELQDDWVFLDRHGTVGVGRYDARWTRIEAEWYMALQGRDADKVQLDGPGFGVRFGNRSPSTLRFPNLAAVPSTATLTLSVIVAGVGSGVLQLVDHGVSGAPRTLAVCDLGGALAGKHVVTCPFTRVGSAINTTDVALRYQPTATAVGAADSVILDWWSLSAAAAAATATRTTAAPAPSPTAWRLPRVDWSAGGARLPIPAGAKTVRAVDSIVWLDNRTYIYTDVTPQGEIGAFSSANGRNWSYHGIVVHKHTSDADAAGVGTPSALVRGDGRVFLYFKQSAASGPRGIGIAAAAHPLGPFSRLLPAAAAPPRWHRPYGPGGIFDDAQVFEHEGLYHMLHSRKYSTDTPGCVSNKTTGRNDCVEWMVSKDAQTWERRGVVLAAHDAAVGPRHCTKADRGLSCIEGGLEPMSARIYGDTLVLLTDGRDFEVFVAPVSGLRSATAAGLVFQKAAEPFLSSSSYAKLPKDYVATALRVMPRQGEPRYCGVSESAGGLSFVVYPLVSNASAMLKP